MKPEFIGQEILLFTDTGFGKRQYCDYSSETVCPGSAEQLEKACWDGLLPELLPGIVNLSTDNNKLYIWKILNGEHLLCVNLGAYPQETDGEASLNPYCFLDARVKN